MRRTVGARQTDWYIFGMASAAALRTYGLMSAAHFLIARTTMLPIMGTLIPERTRRAMARMSGLGSDKSF